MTSMQQKLVTAITITGLMAVWFIAHNLVSEHRIKAVFEPMKRFCGL